MESFISTLVSLLLVLGFGSCSSEKSLLPSDPLPPSGEEEHPVEKDPLAPGAMYDWETLRDGEMLPSDMVLIYGGGRNRNNPAVWRKEHFADYLSYVDEQGKEHWLFDGFLFLEIFDWDESKQQGCKFLNGMRYNNHPLRAACKEDWARLIRYYFEHSSGIAALDAAACQTQSRLGDPTYKTRVVIGLPEPIRQYSENDTSTRYWGEVDGRRLDFGLKNDRLTACRWFIDRVREEFNKKNFRYVELAGFYWIPEKTIDTEELIRPIGDYLSSLNYSFQWIPYFKAHGFEKWRDLGFDYAYLQPNYFFNEQVDSSRLDEACRMADQHGMGMEIEFTDHVLHSYGKGIRLHEYMEAFKSSGIWSKCRMAYYQGSRSFPLLKKSLAPEDRKLYYEFCHFVGDHPLNRGNRAK